ncbi:cyclic-di-AMP phosphodiesterase PgpH [Desulfovibrionales bacterium]
MNVLYKALPKGITKPSAKSGPQMPTRLADLALAQKSQGGLAFLLAVLLSLSLIAGINFKTKVKVFIAGEIATQDVTADQDLMVEEKESTRLKLKQLEQAQPPFFDLSHGSGAHLTEAVNNVLGQLKNANPVDLEQIRWQIAEILNSEISASSAALLRNNELQILITVRILPWLSDKFDHGVISDSRWLQQLHNGILMRDPTTKEDILRQDLDQIRDLPRLREDLETYLREEVKLSLRQRKAIIELISPLLYPTLTLNPEATQQRMQQVMAGVEPVFYQIKKGEIIVRQGERVNSQAQLKLQALYSQEPAYFEWRRPLGIFTLSLLVALGLVLSTTGHWFKPLENRDALFIASTILFFAIPAKMLSIVEPPLAERLLPLRVDELAFLFPVAGAAGLLALFLPPVFCFFSNLLLSFVCCQMVSGNLGIFIYFFIGGRLNIFLLKRAQNRNEMLKSVLPLLGGLIVAWNGVNLMESQNFNGWILKGVFVTANACISLLAILSLSPIVEMVLGYTSRFKLMELINLEQPLLQELMVVAPGTYHHSLIVANMVEAGAQTIGANALLCKVAALYHDIGKLKSPQYFIENQYRGKNRHDKLAPPMSALILIAHVKKGVELARQHRLGQEVIDIIKQHHGTSLISYFYYKAVSLAESRGAEPICKEDYQYPGPKPQSREAGLVMLADAIEASSRSFVDPTPARLKGHIESMTKKIFSDSQLDESELTMKDLHMLADNFLRILTGIFHQRIEYPGPRPEKRQPPQLKTVQLRKPELSHPLTTKIVL